MEAWIWGGRVRVVFRQGVFTFFFVFKKIGSTTLRVPESSLTSVLTKPVVA